MLRVEYIYLYDSWTAVHSLRDHLLFVSARVNVKYGLVTTAWREGMMCWEVISTRYDDIGDTGLCGLRGCFEGFVGHGWVRVGTQIHTPPGEPTSVSLAKRQRLEPT